VGNCVVWQGQVGGNDYEILLYDKRTGITDTLTENNYPDRSPQVWGDCIVWYGGPLAVGNCKDEIYLYDKSTGETVLYYQLDTETSSTNVRR
jgi:hypothetical protein